MVPALMSTSADEFAPSFTATGVMCFVSSRDGGLGDADVWRSVPSNGVYSPVEHVGAPVNTEHLDSAPFIAADESFIIFESDRPGGFGQQDLYVSFRRDDEWSTPANLGSAVNTEQIEDEAYVSPDGKYLFFNRRAAYTTRQHTDIYWVDFAAVIDTASAH